MNIVTSPQLDACKKPSLQNLPEICFAKFDDKYLRAVVLSKSNENAQIRVIHESPENNKVFVKPFSDLWGYSQGGEFQGIKLQDDEYYEIGFLLEVSEVSPLIMRGYRKHAWGIVPKKFVGMVVGESDDSYLVQITNRSPRFIGQFRKVLKGKRIL